MVARLRKLNGAVLRRADLRPGPEGSQELKRRHLKTSADNLIHRALSTRIRTMTGSKRRHSDTFADISTPLTAPPASGLQRLGGTTFFRARDAAELGLNSRSLQGLVDDGTVLRVARGLYRSMETEPNEHFSVGAVCARVPDAIVCLQTALRIHELGTQLPRRVWIGIPHKARAPRAPELPIRLVRFSRASLHYGIVNAEFDGVPARVTNPARTVVDCFRFRRLFGIHVALEALRDALYDRKASVDEIWRAAEACRARSLVGPALEAMSA